MNRTRTNLILAITIVMLIVGPLLANAIAQSSKPIKTATPVVYHGGPVMAGTGNIYLIGYADWPTPTSPTVQVIADFILGLGISEYSKINTQYFDSVGDRPNGRFYGGTHYERIYPRGEDLKDEDMQAIIADMAEAGEIPVDSRGIYLAAGTSDVSSDSTGFCQPHSSPNHGTFTYLDTRMK